MLWRGVAVEGLYLVTVLLLRLVESSWLVAMISTRTPAYATAAAIWITHSLLCEPLRLGRLLWYLRLTEQPNRAPSLRALWEGYDCRREAVRWRWRRLWRRLALSAGLAVFVVLVLPVQAVPLRHVWWSLAGVTAAVGAMWWWVRRCRYSLVPLLLLQGYPMPRAMMRSLHLTRGRLWEWTRFWLQRAGWLPPCLLFPPLMLWVLPRVRLAYARLLLHWVHG